MSLLLVVLLAAIVVGWLAGGSLAQLGALTLRDSRLVVLAALAQLVGTVAGGPLYPVGLALSAGLVTAFLIRNRGLRGTGLIALGLLANALVVGANGAMPVSDAAAARVGTSTQAIVSGADRRHQLTGPGTRLAWLADVVPVALPLRPEVVSPGDVLVAAGVAQLVVVGMRSAGVSGPGKPRGRPRRALPPVPADSLRDGARSPLRRRGPPAVPRRPH